MKRICIVGISGKLGRYMTQHALDRGYDVTGVCRPQSVEKMTELQTKYGDRIKIYPGRTDERATVAAAAQGCDAVLTVLAPWGVTDYSSNTVRAVMAGAKPDARLIFSCGWHISRDGKDRYDWKIRFIVKYLSPVLRWLRLVDIADQDRACALIFAGDRKWTVVRGSDLEEGESQGLPVWSDHVGDPILASNLTRRTDFALFMVAAAEDDSLIQKAPAIVGCQTESAREFGAEGVAV